MKHKFDPNFDRKGDLKRGRAMSQLIAAYHNGYKGLTPERAAYMKRIMIERLMRAPSDIFRLQGNIEYLQTLLGMEELGHKEEREKLEKDLSEQKQKYERLLARLNKAENDNAELTARNESLRKEVEEKHKTLLEIVDANEELHNDNTAMCGQLQELRLKESAPIPFMQRVRAALGAR